MRDHSTSRRLERREHVTTAILRLLILSVVVAHRLYRPAVALAQFALAGFGAWVTARLDRDAGRARSLLAGSCGMLASYPRSGLLDCAARRCEREVSISPSRRSGSSQMIYSVIFNNGTLTGGSSGRGRSRPALPGWNIDPIRTPTIRHLRPLPARARGLIVANVRRGRTGRRLIAVRANERVAASIGCRRLRREALRLRALRGDRGIAGVCSPSRTRTCSSSASTSSGRSTPSCLRGRRRSRLGVRGIVGALRRPAPLPPTLTTLQLFGSPVVPNYLLIFAGAVPSSSPCDSAGRRRGDAVATVPRR